MGYYFGGNSECILDRREWQKHRFGFKLTNWWEKQSAYNSPCDFKKHHMLKKEKEKKDTVLVCHAWLRWLVTNFAQLSYWWRKTRSDMFSTTCLNVPCFHQDLLDIIFRKWSLFQLINISYLTVKGHSKYFVGKNYQINNIYVFAVSLIFGLHFILRCPCYSVIIQLSTE